MDNKTIANTLRKILKIRIDEGGSMRGVRDEGATLAATRAAIQTLLEVLDPPIGVESETLDARETGPENSREEVVGTSTRGKSSNLSSVGFSGGRPMAA